MLIVVIEEDIAMRALIAEWLTGVGYVVRRRASVDSGITPDHAEVALVILNLRNLKSQGTDEVRSVQASYPRAALIGLSTQLGRSIPGRSALARAIGVSCLVAKPFDCEDLLKAVTDTVGSAH